MTAPSASRFLKPATPAKEETPAPAPASVFPANDAPAEETVDLKDLQDLRIWG
jgi:hypothetical protein